MSEAEECLVAFDTAGEDAVVGHLGPGGELIDATVPSTPGERPGHAASLLGAVEDAVEGGGGWGRVGHIGVGVGPGSFTGVRIGIATARALAQARGLPLAPLGTLDALALGVADRIGRSDRHCLALADARRGEVFAQLHDGSGRALAGAAVLAPGDVAGWLRQIRGKPLANGAEQPLAGGSGALRFARELEAAGVEVLPPGDPAHRLSARHLCALANAAGTAEPVDVRPVYLRQPDAKRWLDRDRS